MYLSEGSNSPHAGQTRTQAGLGKRRKEVEKKQETLSEVSRCRSVISIFVRRGVMALAASEKSQRAGLNTSRDLPCAL